LERRKTPRAVHSFKAAAVELNPILSLPHNHREPTLAVLKWKDEEYERYDQVDRDFDSFQLRHHASDSCPECRHQLGGYARWQQEFREEVVEKGLAMLLQIGSDGNSEMGCGDGGELTFYADAKAVARGRFERVWGTRQGG
jgi:uncharacterized protein YwqG